MDIFDVVAGAIKVGSQIKQTNQELNSTMCPHCGYQLPKAAMFCSRCGNKTVVVRKELPDNNPNQQNQQNPQSQQNQQKILPQAFACAGCKAPLAINKSAEVLVCPYCDLQNVNPYYERIIPQPMHTAAAEPKGCVKCMFDSTNYGYRRITVTVKETGEKIEITNGQSGLLYLKKGLYTLGFNFAERKYYERNIRVYSQFTNVSVACISGKTRNAINISYADGVLVNSHMLEFGRFKPDDYIQKLYALGFVNIDKRPGSRGMSIFSSGRVTDILIEDISIRNAGYSPEDFSGICEVIIKDGSLSALRIPQEARITVVF